ncbi:MAG: T9SS type A sorting domain-containing protein [Candidatus Eiseniibacteriota bacterium]
MAPIAIAAALAIAVALLAVSAAHAQQSLYWLDTNYGLPRLWRSNPDGTNPASTPLAPYSLPEGLALDSGSSRLYWSEAAWSGAQVYRIGANLGGRVSLYSGGSSMHGIVLDVAHNFMYWTSSNLVTGAAIERANLDGTGHILLQGLAAGSNPRGIALDAANGRLIWVDYNFGTLSILPLAGGPITTLATGQPGLWGVAYNATNAQVLMTNYITGAIYSTLPPYTTLTTVVSGLSNPTYLAYDPTGGKIYWSEAGAGVQKIQRANLNGTLIQNLGLPIAAFGGLAVGNAAVADVPLPPDQEAVTEFALAPPTPNPARLNAHVQFALPQSARVLLRVMDIQGREVARLADGEFAGGRHSADWSFSGARAAPAAGLYFLRFEAAGRVMTRRLALIR